jgi:N-acetylmuramoyl-L-alanine amidase
MRRLVLLFLVTLLLMGYSSPTRGEEDAPAPKKSVKAGAMPKKSAKKGVKKSAKKEGAPKSKSAGQHPAKKSAPPLAAGTETAAAAPSAKLAHVTEMRHWSTPDYTRIAVSLDREAPFEKHQIAQNAGTSSLSRLYFDIPGARLGAGVKDLQISDGLLKTARIAQYKADTVRVVLDMDKVKDYKIFTFADPFRIIVDVKGERREELSRLEPEVQAPTPAAELAKVPAKEPAKEPSTRPKPFLHSKIRRIVVDPGHGGKDPGATGPTGLQEKEVVLTTGLLLARKIREELGIDVVMTRSSDIFIELQERTAMANQVGADLFVSIHANASLNRNTSGMETYYLNLAKTEKVAQLAARENGTSLEKVSLLQAVLFDLMANYKLNDSAHMAEEVQKALYKKISGQYSAVKNLGVKQGPFYVLVGATMPSILVETAFISNEREEARLKDPLYLEQTADGIFQGIKAYIASLK